MQVICTVSGVTIGQADTLPEALEIAKTKYRHRFWPVGIWADNVKIAQVQNFGTDDIIWKVWIKPG